MTLYFVLPQLITSAFLVIMYEVPQPSWIYHTVSAICTTCFTLKYSYLKFPQHGLFLCFHVVLKICCCFTKYRKQVYLCDRGFCTVTWEVTFKCTVMIKKNGILLPPNCSCIYPCDPIWNIIIIIIIIIVIIIIIIFGVEEAQVSFASRFWKDIRNTTEGGYGSTNVFRIHAEVYPTKPSLSHTT
jgi:hypothetical protein